MLGKILPSVGHITRTKLPAKKESNSIDGNEDWPADAGEYFRTEII